MANWPVAANACGKMSDKTLSQRRFRPEIAVFRLRVGRFVVQFKGIEQSYQAWHSGPFVGRG
jgi:hypothetical protein